MVSRYCPSIYAINLVGRVRLQTAAVVYGIVWFHVCVVYEKSCGGIPTLNALTCGRFVVTKFRKTNKYYDNVWINEIFCKLKFK